MKYNCRELGEELKNQLKQGYDIKRISSRFFEIHLEDYRQDDPLIIEVIDYLSMMEEDPQFEYTEEQLLKIAEFLYENERDALAAFIKRNF